MKYENKCFVSIFGTLFQNEQLSDRLYIATFQNRCTVDYGSFTLVLVTLILGLC